MSAANRRATSGGSSIGFRVMGYGPRLTQNNAASASHSERMPHLNRHALDGVGIFAIDKSLIANIKGYNDAYHNQ